jgi:hypothetical protein
MHWSAPVATSVPGRALTFGCCRLRCRTGRCRRSCHVEWTGAASANVPRSMHAGSSASSNHLYPSPSSTCSDSNCLQLANRRSILVAQPRDAPRPSDWRYPAASSDGYGTNHWSTRMYTRQAVRSTEIARERFPTRRGRVCFEALREVKTSKGNQV